MTMPSERTRNLLQAGAFLKELAANQAVPKTVRQEAYRLLRHYPTISDVEAIAGHEERLRELTTGIDDGDGSDIAVSMRQEQVLAAVRENLAAAREKLAAESAPTELIATDLRAALDAGAQAGRSDNEQELDRLFASFCIGK